MIIGYARVSTLEQNPDLQIDALKNAGAEKIFIDTISGSTKERPELDKMIAILRPGDIVLVWSVPPSSLRFLNYYLSSFTTLQSAAMIKD
jgi:DNA invertase Pin-like site-specific DNA recombinase